MCAAMVDRNPEYPDYGRPMYDSNPQNDYSRPAYESYQQPGDYRRGQEYGQERYNPTSQYPGSSDPPVVRSQASLCSCIIFNINYCFFLVHCQYFCEEKQVSLEYHSVWLRKKMSTCISVV